MLVSPDIAGRFRRREDVPAPAAYAVFDCETTGTVPGVDEIVSFAVVRLDPDGVETARLARLVRPSRPIPAEATAVHGISDADVASAPRLRRGRGRAARAARRRRLRRAQRRVRPGDGPGTRCRRLTRPAGVACTLDAFRMLEPLADDHTLESTCARHGILLERCARGARRRARDRRAAARRARARDRPRDGRVRPRRLLPPPLPRRHAAGDGAADPPRLRDGARRGARPPASSWRSSTASPAPTTSTR